MKPFKLDSDCAVDLGEKPTDVEETALEELARFLTTIFGAFGGSGNRIVMGTPSTNSVIRDVAQELSLDGLTAEGFVVDQDGLSNKQHLIIASKTGRGVLYGVYTILELMGASFALLEPSLPRLANFRLRTPIRDQPAFPIRCASGVVCSAAQIPWYARNRFNRIYVHSDGADFEKLAAEAQRFGIEMGISGSDFTLAEDALEPPLNPRTGHTLCAAMDETWDYWVRLIERRLRGHPSCRAYSFRLTDFRPNPIFLTCEECASIHPAERAIKAIRLANDLALRNSARLSFRTWGLDFMDEAYTDDPHQVTYGWNPDLHLGRVVNETPPEVEFVTKETWGDFMITYPPNKWIGRCSPHNQLVEFQVEPAEYRGNDTIPCSMVERWARVMKLARDHSVEGVWACSWGTSLATPSDAPIGEIVNSINRYAFAKLSWNPGIDARAIYDQWARRVFPECAGEIVELMRLSTRAVEKMMYVLGQRFNSHSGISSTIHHVKWCFHHYGFHDNGGKVTREMLKPSERNLRKVMEEKDEALQIVGKNQDLLEGIRNRMNPASHAALSEMLEEMRKLAALWKEYARSFFIHGMLAECWSAADADRLRQSCQSMSEIAEALDDNSGFSGILWRGAQSPSLQANMRSAVASLVKEYLDFLASKEPVKAQGT